MMQDDKKRRETYLNRAEELRSVAETMKSTDTRDTLLRLAVDYDKMADRLTPKQSPP